MQLATYQLRVLRELREGDTIAELSRRLGSNPGAVAKSIGVLQGKRLIEGSYTPWTYRITDAGRRLLEKEDAKAERVKSSPVQEEMF